MSGKNTSFHIQSACVDISVGLVGLVARSLTHGKSLSRKTIFLDTAQETSHGNS
jgi:hypothetical protein